MWISVLWAVLQVAIWITHVGGKFRHGLLEKSLAKVANPFSPLTAFKNARNPKFVQIVLGVPVRGTEIWKNLSKFEKQ